MCSKSHFLIREMVTFSSEQLCMIKTLIVVRMIRSQIVLVKKHSPIFDVYNVKFLTLKKITFLNNCPTI